MYANSYLGIKITAMVSTQQEKIVKAVKGSQPDGKLLHDYEELTAELRALIEKWEKIL